MIHTPSSTRTTSLISGAEQRRQQRTQGPEPIHFNQRLNKLSMYFYPPQGSVLWTDFAAVALKRLKLLQMIDRVVEKSKESSVADLDDALHEALSKELFFSDGSITNREDLCLDDAKNDLVSHFILRIAFCKDPVQRSWFIQQEVDLFKHKFRHEVSRTSLDLFLMRNGLESMKQISTVEKEGVINELIGASGFDNRGYHTREAYFKVPFVQALDLVRSRRVFLRDGYAYVISNDLVLILGAAFRANLSFSCAQLAKKRDALLATDRRIEGLCNFLNKDSYLGKQEFTSTDQVDRVTLNKLDQVSKISFPLCMRHMFDQLHKNRHAKHGARMQLSLFLKGVGLTLDESMQFWRKAFKNLDDEQVMDRVKKGNFQGACTRFYEITHQMPEQMMDTIGHPNQYFEESRKLILSKSQKSENVSQPIVDVKSEDASQVVQNEDENVELAVVMDE